MRRASFRVSVCPSRTLRFTLLAAHWLIAYSVIALSMPPVLKISLLLCIGVSLAHRRRPQTHRDYIFRPDGRVECLASAIGSSVGADKTAASKTTARQGGRAKDALFAVADGDTPSNSDVHHLAQIVEVDAASQLLGPLMVVRFRNASAGMSLVLLPDSFYYPDDYRRVRLWLKWQGKGDADDVKDGLAGGTQDGI